MGRLLQERRGWSRECAPVWLAGLGARVRPLVGMSVKRYWLCPGCGTRNERTKQKCVGEGCRRSRPKPRLPKHAEAIRGDNYETVYVPLAAVVHGVTDESCNLCGRPRGVGRHHRDHGHNKDELSFGKPRGILCFQCNNRLPREATEEWLHKAYLYLRRVRKFYEVRQEGVEGGLGSIRR